MIESQIIDWLTLLLRFLHVLTAIAWIGASFYFIWLDLSLEVASPEKQRRGLAGELWSIHGGGIYEVGKYRLAPPVMPANLHWFKWEAYSTWLTGTGLLIVFFYLRADSQLMGAEGWAQSPAAAVAASVAFLLAGLGLYELFMRGLPRAGAGVQLLALLALLVAASWLAFRIFPPRAAVLHVGAMLGTIMAANVFLGIIPSQKALVGAIERGAEPDAELARRAKQRSTHNNYLTLPVLLCMLANHAPMLFGHPHAWLLVVALALAAVAARQYFNASHAGRVQPAWLVGACVAFISIVAAAALTGTRSLAIDGEVTAAQVQAIVAEHCAGCHAESPTQGGFSTAPGGYLFRTPEDLQAQAGLVVSALESGYMPLGNLTGMSDQQRAVLLAWTRRD